MRCYIIGSRIEWFGFKTSPRYLREPDVPFESQERMRQELGTEPRKGQQRRRFFVLVHLHDYGAES